MLTEICAELRNYFCTDADKHLADFEINGGIIAPSDFLKEGQYFRIVGSVFNDGVYKYPASGLKDETFRGAVWAMRVPPDVVSLSADVQKFVESDAGKPSAFTAESFGGYSYSRATNPDGSTLTWQGAFRSRLNKYRKVRA